MFPEHLRLALHANGGLTLQVKVVTRSARTEVVESMPDGTLKIRLRSVPEKGRANEELCRFLSVALCVPQSAVSILSGETSQRKLVRIDLAKIR